MTMLEWLLVMQGSDNPRLDAHLLEQRAIDDYRAGRIKIDPRHLARALSGDDDSVDAGAFHQLH